MDSYYYLDSNNKQCGPVSSVDLLRMGISPQTMVWKQGMSNWMPASSLPELSHLFQSAPPPPGVGQNQGPVYTYDSTPQYPNQSGGFNQGSNTPYTPPKPDNYLVWSILVTLFCCLPAGVYAIILSSKVDSLYASGNYDEAQRNADEAKKWCIISAVISLVIGIIYFFIVVVVGASSYY